MKFLNHHVVITDYGKFKCVMFRYPYFDVVVGLLWSNDLESYDGCQTGQRSPPRQNRIPWSRLGVGCEAENPTSKKNMFVEKLLTFETGWKQQRRPSMD